MRNKDINIMDDLIVNLIFWFLVSVFVVKLFKGSNYRPSKHNTNTTCRDINTPNSKIINDIESYHYPSHNIDNTWNDINTNPSYSHIPSNIYYDTFNNHSQH